MDFKEVIKRHLDQMAQQDFAFAERYKQEGKSLDKCIQYIFSQAQKKKTGNCAAIEDAIVYGWAVHYYTEDNVNVDKSVKAKVVAPGGKIKPIKAVVKDKKQNKCVELDLFGEF